MLVDQYSGSQPSLAGSRKRALRDKIALSRNVCFFLMGMDCKDAFIFAFVSSQTICSSQRRVHNPRTSGNTWTMLSPTSHERLELQTLHFSQSYNRIESPVELTQKRGDHTNPSAHEILPAVKSLSTFHTTEPKPQVIIICIECDVCSRCEIWE